MTLFVHGSINVDHVLRVGSLPRGGETVMAESRTRFPGGKGANQAIAAARLGADVAMAGMVGRDEDGAFMTQTLQAAGIDVSAVRQHESLPSGTAMVAVDRGGENMIIVSPGANGALEDVGSETLQGICLAQLETPVDAIAQIFRRTVGTTILNAAPAIIAGAALFPVTDILILNESELAFYTDDPTANLPAAARQLLCRPGQTIVITLGSRGATAIDADRQITVPGHSVPVVDATGAGDCFCGALAVALERAMPMPKALAFANAAAALSTTKHGAGSSAPTSAELIAFLRGRA